MRRIETKEQKDKKIRRNQIIIGVILILLMVLSTAGYAVFNRDPNQISGKFKYNNFEFKNENGYWTTNINDLNYYFLYTPNDVNKRELILNSINNYHNKPLYINSENFEARQNIIRNLYYISSNIQDACLEGEKCSNEELPVKNCNDNFIIIKEGEEKIYQENNCVFISGSYENLQLLTEEFIYKILGII